MTTNNQSSIILTPTDPVLVGKYPHGAGTVLVLLDSDSGAFTVTLPDANGSEKQQFLFKNLGANSVTLNTVNGQPIDYTTVFSHVVLTKEFYSLMSDGNGRWISLESN